MKYLGEAYDLPLNNRLREEWWWYLWSCAGGHFPTGWFVPLVFCCSRTFSLMVLRYICGWEISSYWIYRFNIVHMFLTLMIEVYTILCEAPSSEYSFIRTCIYTEMNAYLSIYMIDKYLPIYVSGTYACLGWLICIYLCIYLSV